MERNEGFCCIYHKMAFLDVSAEHHHIDSGFAVLSARILPSRELVYRHLCACFRSLGRLPALEILFQDMDSAGPFRGNSRSGQHLLFM